MAVFKEAVLNEESGEPERLRERFRIAKAAVFDPWLERNDPVHPNQFAEIDSEPELTPVNVPLVVVNEGAAE